MCTHTHKTTHRIHTKLHTAYTQNCTRLTLHTGDDILVGKTVSLPEDPTGLQRFTRRDASLALRNSESGVVDQVRV